MFASVGPTYSSQKDSLADREWSMFSPSIPSDGPQGYQDEMWEAREEFNKGLRVKDLEVGKSYTFKKISKIEAEGMWYRAGTKGLKPEDIDGIQAFASSDITGFKVVSPPTTVGKDTIMAQVQLLKADGSTQDEYTTSSGQKVKINIWFLPKITPMAGGRRRRTGVKKSRGGRKKKTRRSK